MTSLTLVTGGTGTLGRLVVPLLRDAGRRVRVLSRGGHAPQEGAQFVTGVEFVTGDVSTGEGLDAAVKGAGTIVHCAGSAKGDEVKARNLVRAASRADGPHLVFVSVVGADRVPVVSGVDRAMFGYFAAKREAERVVAGCGLPWTTLRATQFHDWIWTTLGQMAAVPLPVLPTWAGVRFQPVDAGEVAARLAALALGAPAGLVPDLAGPRVYPMEDLARDYLRAGGRRRLVTPMPAPGRAARAFRAGANLPLDGADLGGRTWEEFLAGRAR
ncbi:SDR family oxidoreductase [Microbispora amethystogenes]|uniref:NmrA family transcriptional regulator n=1 Tax=Microbispora amethystogenes TaxID=1427754 RepID=A0ABQ4FDR7_9ACTN|nr:NAD(P)H-binding protein [Microbispora amethystogenes]GIH32966.1 NmrA family transcriptional regulator [Microbispora amethystogenes]